MANPKKDLRRQRALERLEKRIKLDGLGFAEPASQYGNTFSQEHEHHTLRRKLNITTDRMNLLSPIKK